MSNWVNQTAEIIKGLGYRVFVHDHGKTWLHFTDKDAKRFGYVQDERGWYHLTTEWVPSKKHGSGGSMGDHPHLTPEILERTLNAEGWGFHRRGDSYKSLEQFLKQHAWGGGLKEV